MPSPRLIKSSGPLGTDDDQILASVVGEIGKYRTRCAIKHANTCSLGHINKRAVAPIAVEAVRKTGRLADIKIVVAVTIEISRTDAIVAIYINSLSSIQYGSPMIDAHDTFASGKTLRPQMQLRKYQ